MRIAFDTSVLVAALVEPHPLHDRSTPWIEAVSSKRVTGSCTTHALAETWSVLTRIPIEPAISPPMATAVIERLSEVLEIVELGLDAYQMACRRCSEKDVRSGALFDALHLIAAESSGADMLLTFNSKDFQRLEIPGGPAITVPPDPPNCDLD
jgi:predicted nucleic acid-binding protein